MKKQTIILGIAGLTFAGLSSCNSSDTTFSKEVEKEENVKSDSTALVDQTEPDVVEAFDPAKVDLPEGYVLFDSDRGDLNGDGVDDFVLMVKGTDPEEWKKNQFDETVDRNRRGILVYLSEGKKMNLVVENLDCFSSENEDGGVYFPPELSMEIEKGRLFLHYGHGRYGYWRYNFRYQDGKMKLIGFDQSENMGPVVHYLSSYNFLTGKKQEKENINFYSENPENEVFKETWSDLPKKELITLSSIEDFDELYFD